jgi:hypothetical protein
MDGLPWCSCHPQIDRGRGAGTSRMPLPEFSISHLCGEAHLETRPTPGGLTVACGGSKQRAASDLRGATALRAILITDYESLIAAVRARIAEIGISYSTLDFLAGTQVGYSAKILGPTPSKSFGPVSLGCILGALGVRLVLKPDPEAEARMRPRWVRKHPGISHMVTTVGRGRAAAEARKRAAAAADSISVPPAI